MFKFIYMETYGCSANLNNSEIIRGLIKQSGLELTSNPKIADLLIINTCIVKEPTEKKIEARISELEKLNKPLILTGCMPDVRAKELDRRNIYLLSNHQIKNILKLIKKISDSQPTKEFLENKPEIKLNLPKSNEVRKIGITQILEGCLGECSFCITRLAKGKLFSYPQEDIIKNIENDVKNGCKEIWLTSQDNASYGLDNKERKLPELLAKILAIEGNFRIRLGMMNPNNVLPILPELIELFKNEKMYKYLHIPIQSGSNKILKSMNRYYQVEDFIKIIKAFRHQIPEITLATDLIVAYPQETKEDFLASFNLIKEIKPDQLNLSKFWPRKNTPAALVPQIDKKIAKKRASIIMKLFDFQLKAKNNRLLGKTAICLVYDSFNNNYLARTSNYKLVLIKSTKNILGKIMKIKLVKAERNHFLGELL